MNKKQRKLEEKLRKKLSKAWERISGTKVSEQQIFIINKGNPGHIDVSKEQSDFLLKSHILKPYPTDGLKKKRNQ